LDYIKNYKFKLSAEDILDKFESVKDDIATLTNDKKNEALDQVMLYLKANDISASQAMNIEKYMNFVSDEVVVDFMQNVLATKNHHNIKMVHKVLKTRVIEATRAALGIEV